MHRVLKIPVAMATQHPDCASRYISAKDEVQEALVDLTPFEHGGFGCDEKMIDYEGKLTPYHQPEWIIEEIYKRGVPIKLGKEVLLTPRIPAERLERVDRQIMIMWSSIMTNKVLHEFCQEDCIQYMIHPMVESTSELITTNRRLLKLLKFAKEEVGLSAYSNMRLVPLFEDAVRTLHAHEIMNGFKQQLIRELGEYYDFFRVFLGKSDSAMLYGHAASFYALKIALSRLTKWAQVNEVNVYPIIGVGALPFRGGLRGDSVDNFVSDYKGFSTVTIQSGIRFDRGEKEVKAVISKLRESANKQAEILDSSYEKKLVSVIAIFTRSYLRTLLPIVSLVCTIADKIPERRDRMGRDKYPRSFPSQIALLADRELLEIVPTRVNLPRAIRFVASLYTMGIPPAIIGFGQALREIRSVFGESFVEGLLRLYSAFFKDMKFEGQFLNLEVASRYVDKVVIKKLREDVEEVEMWLGEKLEKTEVGLKHDELLVKIRENLNGDVSSHILEAGKLRGSLG